MPIKSPKQKGASGELEAARLLEKWAHECGCPHDLERNLEQVRSGGSDLNGVRGLEIEVKRVEQFAINSWWKQVCEVAAETGKRPFLMHRANRKQWSFRVRAWVYPHAGKPLDIDMDLATAELWFKAYLKDQENEIPKA